LPPRYPVKSNWYNILQMIGDLYLYVKEKLRPDIGSEAEAIRRRQIVMDAMEQPKKTRLDIRQSIMRLELTSGQKNQKGRGTCIKEAKQRRQVFCCSERARQASKSMK
jgi:hypothetical protein